VKRYPTLQIVTSLLRYVSAVWTLAGIGAAVLYIYENNPTPWSSVVGVMIVLGSLVSGAIFYAINDILRCIVDIEANTRATEVNTKAIEANTTLIQMNTKTNGHKTTRSVTNGKGNGSGHKPQDAAITALENAGLKIITRVNQPPA
jgi:hypothetical protein